VKTAWDKVLLFTFSICLIVGLISIALLKPILSDQQWFICIWALAFGGAGFAAFLPGSIEWQLKPGLKATGAFAVLLLVFYFGKGVKSEHGNIKEWLIVPPPVGKGPGLDLTSAAVYVYQDDVMVKAFNPSPPEWLKTPKSGVNRDIKIERGFGSVKIMLGGAEPGSKLFFIVQDSDHWWISSELTVPPPFSMQLEPVNEAVLKRRLP
jgi:hypothetical protein